VSLVTATRSEIAAELLDAWRAWPALDRVAIPDDGPGHTVVASTSGGALAGLVIILALYFAPSIVGLARKVPNIGSVVVINFFLGWTLIGWVVALAMAARSVPAAPGR
jgi:hypothetical protein